MAQDRQQFRELHLFHQRVIQHYALVLEESIKVRVGVSAAAGSINCEEVGERKFNLLRQVLNGRLYFTILQRRVLVKQRRDQRGVDGHQHNADHAETRPNVEVEVRTGAADDPHNQRQNGQPQYERQTQGHSLVLDKQSEGGLVETVLLFHHESSVQGERQGNDRIKDSHKYDEHPSNDDLLEQIRVIRSHNAHLSRQGSRDVPHIWKVSKYNQCNTLEEGECRFDDLEQKLVLSVRITFLKSFIGNVLNKFFGQSVGCIEGLQLTYVQMKLNDEDQNSEHKCKSEVRDITELTSTPRTLPIDRKC
mmetsp:Transcript_57987/g.101915  ORF Transcript_57987/g.101915 Transcript_57987/m.101915 type:complete len:306 (-) Transcript_57987:44-961(-)